MINDPIKLSFQEGLEAAAQIHVRLAYQWFDCARDSTGIEAESMRERARVHQRYAYEIRSLNKEEE